jgi:hypothetical protein
MAIKARHLGCAAIYRMRKKGANKKRNTGVLKLNEGSEVLL